MTDQPIRADYESQHIRIADQAVVGNEIRGKVYSNCQIFGPAMLVPMTGVSFVRSQFEARPEDLVIVIDSRVIFGAIALVDVEFYDCRFSNIGFIGGQHFLDQFKGAAGID